MNYIPYQLDTCDHLRVNFDTTISVHPPKLEVDGFFDESLAQTAETKIGNLLDRYDWVSSRFTNNYRYLKNKAISEGWDDFSLYFWQYFEGLSFEETVLIKRWLKYWTRVYENCTHTVVIEKQDTQLGEDAIERAREFPINELYDGDLRHQYGKFVGLCPFHTESTPSFTIFEDNHYYCFGCSAHGDSIDFAMKTKNISFPEAVKELQ